MKKRLKIFYKRVLPIILTLSSVTLLTVISMLYAKGYRISIGDFSKVENGGSPTPNLPVVVKKTGILAVRSVPDAAKIYLDDKLVDTTNATISSLVPGNYLLQVKKEGFETWEKRVDVYDDKVTDITALLVLKGGGLNPITNSGVDQYSISNNGEVLAFTTKGESKPGVYIIQLSSSPLNIFQSGKKALVVDSEMYPFSDAERISWSPDDQQVLLKMSSTLFYLLDLTKPATQEPVILNTDVDVVSSWETKNTQNKQSAVETLNVPSQYRDLGMSKESVWSPDGEKFYILNKDAGSTDRFTINVYNFEQPLPVGEKREYSSVKYQGLETNIKWYSDSKHLLIITKDKVKIINIDGTNMFEVFSGDVIGAKAFPSPYGDRIIILSKFKSEGNANLYAVSIR